MFVGDAANFLLGGIPGEVQDMFVVDVEPDDLAKASSTTRDLSVGVRTLHMRLSGKGWIVRGRMAEGREGRFRERTLAATESRAGCAGAGVRARG